MDLPISIPAPLARSPSGSNLVCVCVFCQRLPVCRSPAAGQPGAVCAAASHRRLPRIRWLLLSVGRWVGGWAVPDTASCIRSAQSLVYAQSAVYAPNQQLPLLYPRLTPPPACLEAGVGLASGVQISGLASWLQLASGEVLLKLAPALGTLCLITTVLHRIE